MLCLTYFVSFCDISFRFVSFLHFSFRFVVFRFVSFHFVSFSFLSLVVPLFFHKSMFHFPTGIRM